MRVRQAWHHDSRAGRSALLWEMLRWLPGRWRRQSGVNPHHGVIAGLALAAVGMWEFVHGPRGTAGRPARARPLSRRAADDIAYSTADTGPALSHHCSLGQQCRGLGGDDQFLPRVHEKCRDRGIGCGHDGVCVGFA